jgi:hypothetical protein
VLAIEQTRISLRSIQATRCLVYWLDRYRDAWDLLKLEPQEVEEETIGS